MSDSAFRKRFSSSYDSSPLLTLPVWKRYRGTSKLILGTDSEEDEEVDESSNVDSKSEDVEYKGPTTDDEDPAAKDEGLAAGVKGLSLDGKSYGVNDEIHGLDDESYGIDGEGRSIESDGLGLEEEEEAVPEGQRLAIPVVGTTVSEPLGLIYWALRGRELTLEEDHVYSTFEVGQGSGSTSEPERSERTPPSPEWTFVLLPISRSLSVVPLPVSSPMIPLTVPSPIATSIATILVDEDQFIEVGAQLNLYRGILQDHTLRLDAMLPTLFAEIDKDRPVLAVEAWAGPDRFIARAVGDEGSCDGVRAGEGS
uniref:Uncharacterized protein n=1 Tax=Tanacetum cinerariifolium TaxID=118510 RepID=A0A699I0C7_TANCI|nr:hypothetical protein [Tanacetum cinerariifolium]